MHKLAHKLFLAWLLLSLLVAPLQAQLAPLGPIGQSSCPMSANESHGHSKNIMDPAPGAQAPCTHCQHTHCDSGQCKTKVCSNLQMQLNVALVPMLAVDQPVFVPYPAYSQRWVSVPAPPLYRPPV